MSRDNLKVKKPYTNIIKRLILSERESVFITRKGEGLYMSRLAKQNKNMLGIRSIGTNKWLMWRKTDIQVSRPANTHFEFFGEVKNKKKWRW